MKLSPDSAESAQPDFINFIDLRRYVVFALGFNDQPTSIKGLRSILSPASEASLDSHMNNMPIPGAQASREVSRKTLDFIDYYFMRFSGVVEYRYTDPPGYVLSQYGQAECDRFLEDHVSSTHPLPELPAMLQQLAEPAILEAA